MAKHEIRTTVEIRASPERVWSILSDFSAYAGWNPFITKADGLAKEGQRLRVRVKPVGGRSMLFRPKVIVAIPQRELRWRGHFFVPGLFDGEHSFSIQSAERVTLLVQSERFTGLLVPLFRNTLDDSTRPGFEAMNLALKHRAEKAD